MLINTLAITGDLVRTPFFYTLGRDGLKASIRANVQMNFRFSCACAPLAFPGHGAIEPSPACCLSLTVHRNAAIVQNHPVLFFHVFARKTIKSLLYFPKA